jgi:NAD(P)H-quinone oxidoreductase subunit L
MDLPLNLPLIPLLVYVGLGGAYLVVMPALVYLYLNTRFHTAGSFERLIAYFFVFLFFPGMLLLGPLLNSRPQKRTLA